METNDFSAWMLDEHAKIHELGDQLREKIASPPRGDRAQWIDDLRRRFDDFTDRIRRHMTIEEDGGYLTHVTDLRPTLSEAVAIIRHEHEELKHIVEDVQRAIHELGPNDILFFRDCCRRIEHLLLWIERHEDHENHLVIYAFTQDIGTSE